MNSRERVLAALNHEEPDRVPLDLGGWVTSMHKIAYENLVNYLRKDAQEPDKFPTKYRLKDWIQQLPDIDESVLSRLGIDTRYVRPGSPQGDSWKLDRWEDEDYYYVTDGWGVTRKKPKKEGLYYDIVFSKCPLKDATVKDLESYNWPDPEDPGFLKGVKDKAKEIKNDGYAVVADFNFESWYENCWYMRGYERFYKDMYKNPEFVDALLEKVSDLHVKFLDMILEEVGEYLDVVMQGDDLANQDGPAMSLEMYRKFVKPKQAKVFDLINDKTDAKVFYHCCGSVKELLPELIDIGVDIINPVQVSAKGMDTEELEREFGEDLTFWGAIDTQKTLPMGSEKEVKEEVKKRVDDLSRDGGYVLTSVHNIQADVPPENIVTMFDTARKI
ncbi:uroporphyrinogen-III decarboxylase [Candidatus Bipolaricaulota bacterium]|nr:uroporphyrinogen-III decarboxylase [Candidatus Bipolaricaulota bacterium]